MAEIVLVRHAATAWSGRRYCGRSDPPLSRTGKATAAQLALTLRAILRPGVRIVSSPRGRAMETARAITIVAGSAQIDLDDRWAETDFGIAEGLTFDELSRCAPGLAASLVAGAADIDWPGGERAAALAARVETAWRDVARDRHGVVVVAHGGPMRIAIALATGSGPADVAIPEPGGFWRLGSAVPGPRGGAPSAR